MFQNRSSSTESAHANTEARVSGHRLYCDGKSWEKIGKKREIDTDIMWNSIRGFSMRCDWNLAKTPFAIVLEYFRLDAIGIWLRIQFEIVLENF